MPGKVRIVYRIVYRSAITGKFVKREYAEANPNTTVRELIEKKDDEQ